MALHTIYLKELAKEREAYQKFLETVGHSAESALIQANQDHNDPQLKQKAQQRLKNAYLDARTPELAHHQGNLRTALKEAQATLERDRIKAESGHNLIARYAGEHGISFDVAEQELKRYAERKTNFFDITKPADQYAALIHKNDDKLTKDDITAAHNMANQELEKINYTPRLTEIQGAERNATPDPRLEIQRLQTSGEAIANQLYGDV